MAQTTLSVRMDETVKKQFDTFCSEVGMNTSVAINLFAKVVLRERKIPFEITAFDDPFYSDSNLIHLNKSIDALNHGKGKAYRLIELGDE
ncbi:MAG: type II toxin-antitoxin system antitoxin, RelB/DinJ family [Candidatus Cloacimonadota bacterium]|nr:MAG: type II toxin-antitoxin system antitoxin, RelB/DinJ family [Candidatus Cloacimonadota bacterium]